MSVSEEHAVAYVRICRDHLPALVAMEEASYPDPWNLGMFTQEITGQSSHFYVALRDGEMVGYAGFWLLLDEAHITKITVAGNERRRGHGQALLEFLMDRARALDAKTVRLEVRASNAAARGLYQRNGFQEVGVRKGYYARAGEDAVVMVKNLE